MQQTLRKIEDMVAALATAEPVVDRIGGALGGRVLQDGSNYRVMLDTLPFQSAHLRERDAVIKIDLELAPGEWRFGDISAAPQAWSIGPAAPDSGRIDAHRDWDVKRASIRCVVSLVGDAPLAERPVKDPVCIVTPV